MLFSYKTEIILSRPIIFAKDPWLDFRRTELPASSDPLYNLLSLKKQFFRYQTVFWKATVCFQDSLMPMMPSASHRHSQQKQVSQLINYASCHI